MKSLNLPVLAKFPTGWRNNETTDLSSTNNRHGVRNRAVYSGRFIHGSEGAGGGMKAYDKQVGGAHYKKMKIQPMQYSMANELDACQHTAIKYITRHEDKAGKKDLYKSLHTVLLLIEEKYEWTDKDSAILEAVMGAMSDETK
jgi:hypothetical protein